MAATQTPGRSVLLVQNIAPFPEMKVHPELFKLALEAVRSLPKYGSGQAQIRHPKGTDYREYNDGNVTAAREAAIPPADQSYTIDSEKSYGGPGSEAGPSTPASVLWESTSRKRKECVHSDPDVELAKKQRVIPNSMSWIFEDVVGAVEEKGSIMVELGWASSMVLLRSMNRAGLEACEALVVDKLGWDTWVEELKTFTEGRLYLAKKSCMTPTKRSGRWAFKKPLSVKVVGGRVYVEVDWENTHENLISIDFGGLEACERPVIAKIGNERWEKELRRSQAGCMYLERKVREI